MKTEQQQLVEKQISVENELGKLTIQKNEKQKDIDVLNQKFQLLQTQYLELSKINENRRKKSGDLLKLQYRKTMEAYRRIYLQSSGISSALNLSNTISELQNETNPVRNTDFLNQLNQLQGELEDKNKFFGDSSFLSNPYISIAVNLASIFVSKLDKSGRVKKMKNLVCVLDVSVKTSPKLEKFESEMKELEIGVDSFNKELNEKFKEFTKSMGKETELKDADKPELEDAFDQYLNENRLESSTGKIQIEEVKIKLEEFNLILTRMNDLLKSLESNLKFVRESYERTICDDNEFKNNFVTNVRGKFETSEGRAKLVREQVEKDVINPYRNYYRATRQKLSESFQD